MHCGWRLGCREQVDGWQIDLNDLLELHELQRKPQKSNLIDAVYDLVPAMRRAFVRSSGVHAQTSMRSVCFRARAIASACKQPSAVRTSTSTPAALLTQPQRRKLSSGTITCCGFVKEARLLTFAASNSQLRRSPLPLRRVLPLFR